MTYREYIKRSQKATIALFKGKENAEINLQAIRNYNMSIATRVYDAIMYNGQYAYTRDGKRLLIYHKSTRGDYIQLSYFCYIRGEMEPVMHTDIMDVKKLCDTLQCGKYINVKPIAT